MGFDVTFHPIGRDQLQRFVFDVINEPALAPQRADELTADASKRDFLRTLYGGLVQIAADPGEIGTVGLACGMIAGFLHPYWYARGQALSFIESSDVPEAAALFTPLPQIANGALGDVKSDLADARIMGNESGSGFIDPAKLSLIEVIVDRAAQIVGRRGPLFDADGREALLAAVSYARARGLGLIEASEVVTPIADACNSNPDNLRAQFMGRMEP